MILLLVSLWIWIFLNEKETHLVSRTDTHQLLVYHLFDCLFVWLFVHQISGDARASSVCFSSLQSLIFHANIIYWANKTKKKSFLSNAFISMLNVSDFIWWLILWHVAVLYELWSDWHIYLLYKLIKNWEMFYSLSPKPHIIGYFMFEWNGMNSN